MSSDTRFDDLLLAFASQQEGLDAVLRTFFSFLHRRTDLYIVDERPTRPVGFAPGAAERILLKAFRSLPYRPPSPLQRGGSAEVSAATASAGAASSQPTTLPPALPARRPEASLQNTPASSAAVPAPTAPLPSAAPALAPSAAPAPSTPAASPAPATSLPPLAVASPGSCAGASRSEPRAGAAPAVAAPRAIAYTPEGKQVPVSNGGVGPGYWWAQTLREVTLYVEVPAATRARDVSLALTACSLALRLGGGAPLLEGELGGGVRPAGAVWTLEEASQAGGGARPEDPRLPGGEGCARSGPRRVWALQMDKALESWWRSALVGPAHPQIDAQLVDSTQSVSEYDEETQAAIRKIMFDQSQQRRGLPTSEALALQAIEQQARLAPDSPL